MGEHIEGNGPGEHQATDKGNTITRKSAGDFCLSNVRTITLNSEPPDTLQSTRQQLMICNRAFH
jgi:hypothetical protein